MITRSLRRLALPLWLAAAMWAFFGAGLSTAWGAEKDFVGVLALAIEDDVAEQLGLTKNQKEKLLELIDAREDEAIELVAQIKDLPPAERQAKLVPFRRESEAKGLALLSKEQQARLERIRLQRAGMDSLAEPSIAERLKLKPEQQTKIAEILKDRAEKLARSDEKTAQVVKAETDRSLSSVLDENQRAAWDAMARHGTADGAAGGVQPAPAPDSGAKPAEVAVE
ncbi:MAG: hypothetical protein NUV77_21290, partial [Thermoguttaceae bacterium]|nr:hypothetical protein [Thermoguttaceae bacterium]